MRSYIQFCSHFDIDYMTERSTILNNPYSISIIPQYGRLSRLFLLSTWIIYSSTVGYLGCFSSPHGSYTAVRSAISALSPLHMDHIQQYGRLSRLFLLSTWIIYSSTVGYLGSFSSPHGSYTAVRSAISALSPLDKDHIQLYGRLFWLCVLSISIIQQYGRIPRPFLISISIIQQYGRLFLPFPPFQSLSPLVIHTG